MTLQRAEPLPPRPGTPEAFDAWWEDLRREYGLVRRSCGSLTYKDVVANRRRLEAEGVQFGDPATL